MKTPDLRPTADLGEDREPFDASAFAEHFRRKSKATEDIGDATDFAEAADRVEELSDRLILYREALVAARPYVEANASRDSRMTAHHIGADVLDKIDAVLSRSGG